MLEVFRKVLLLDEEEFWLLELLPAQPDRSKMTGKAKDSFFILIGLVCLNPSSLAPILIRI